MHKQGDVLNRQKMDGCFFQQVLSQNVRWFLSLHREVLPRFILNSIERPYVPLKNGTRDFKNSSLFKRLAWF